MRSSSMFGVCLLLLASCAHSIEDDLVSNAQDAGDESGTMTLLSVDASDTDTSKTCGVHTNAEGTAYDYGGCPSGQVCGDNGQPNLCGNACVPDPKPDICNNFCHLYNYPSNCLLQYSLSCVTDPPIDRSNCEVWSVFDESYNGCVIDCPTAYCCYLPYSGQGDSGP